MAGRDEELALFRHSLSRPLDGGSVFLLHGPGGIGKTTLLEAMRAAAEQAGLACVRVDGRDMEPTAYGLIRALSGSLGMAAPEAASHEAVLARLQHLPRCVLMIDTFEHLAHLQHWLRAHVLAHLPPDTLVVLAGRAPPDEVWRTDPLWRQGTHVLGLRNLPAAACRQALADRGLAPAQCEAIARLSYGHPLAMMLLADVVRADGGVPLALGTDVIRQLTACFTAQAPSGHHREALEICAHARVTTEDLLADTVDADRATDLFTWLASLSFMDAAEEGLVPHDLVRDALTAELRWRNPERLTQGAGRLLQHYLGRARRGGATARQKAALDIFFLNRSHPVMRQFVDFGRLGALSCEPARHDEHEAMAWLARTELGPEHEAVLRHWTGHEAATFWVVRDGGDVAAAMLCVDIAGLAPDELAHDPALSACHRWLAQRAPLRPGDVAWCARLSVARGGIRHAMPVINAMQTRSFSLWMSHPRLAAYMMAADEPAHWRPMMSLIDFQPIDEGAVLMMDGLPQGLFAHDWRSTPIDEWLAAMAPQAAVPPMPASLPAPAEAPCRTLSQDDFRQAVLDALRQWHDPRAWQTSPLLPSRLVRRACQDGHEAGAVLKQLVREAIDSLSAHPRQAKFFRALDATYLRPAASQELAAERLGLPYGTYRYQLRMGLAHVVSRLWQSELQRSPED